MKHKLVTSPVVYDSVEHTYSLGDTPLRGITKAINDYFYPNAFDGIPESILEKARQRGNKIHAQVEMTVNGFPPNFPAAGVTEFFNFCKTGNIRLTHAEYVVSDEITFATPIDIVDSEFNLYDIKTPKVLKIPYLQWQLSICAYLFELQNGFAPKNLFAVHIRDGKCEVIPIEPIERETVISFLEAVTDNFPFEYDLEPNVTSFLSSYSSLIEDVARLSKEMKETKDNLDKARAELLLEMNLQGVKSFATSDMKVSSKAARVSERFNTKKFKEDEPERYGEYVVRSEVKPSVTIKLTNSKE